MIDSHCRLDFDAFDDNRDGAVSAALDAGVHTLVNIGVDLQHSEMAVALADKYDCVYATVGVHPHDASTFDKNTEEKIMSLADHEKVKAIGEIGLDYYRDLSPRKLQRQVFEQQLEMAVQKNLPVVIHTRESFKESVEIIAKYAPRLVGGVFHCFPGDAQEANEVINLGFKISVGGIITFPKSGMARMAAEVPIEQILLETDCPYLAPVPKRGKRNEPAYVKFVYQKMAELKDMPVDEVEKIVDRNVQKLFGLVETFGD